MQASQLKEPQFFLEARNVGNIKLYCGFRAECTFFAGLQSKVGTTWMRSTQIIPLVMQHTLGRIREDSDFCSVSERLNTCGTICKEPPSKFLDFGLLGH